MPVLLGQLSSALFLDQQGWLGAKEMLVHLGKTAGLLLFSGCMWVMRRS